MQVVLNFAVLQLVAIQSDTVHKQWFCITFEVYFQVYNAFHS